jgi:hypothetical protein
MDHPDKTPVPRSTKWPEVEKTHRAEHPNCAACLVPGAPVQVHHIFPFHYAIALGRPDLELDDRNLISLCETEKGNPAENHHLLIGHLGNFKEGNLSVWFDAQRTWHGMTEAQIKSAHGWKLAPKLKDLDKMTDDEKAALRALMDKTFPAGDKKEEK